MNSLNDALEVLRKVLPQATQEEPKMTKIETLRTAQQFVIFRHFHILKLINFETKTDMMLCRYIHFLTASLSSEEECSLLVDPPTAFMHTQITLCKSEDFSHGVSPFSTHYTPDPSPAYPPFQNHTQTHFMV